MSKLGVWVCVVRALAPFFFLIQRYAALLRIREKKVAMSAVPIGRQVAYPIHKWCFVDMLYNARWLPFRHVFTELMDTYKQSQ